MKDLDETERIVLNEIKKSAHENVEATWERIRNFPNLDIRQMVVDNFQGKQDAADKIVKVITDPDAVYEKTINSSKQENARLLVEAAFLFAVGRKGKNHSKDDGASPGGSPHKKEDHSSEGGGEKSSELTGETPKNEGIHKSVGNHFVTKVMSENAAKYRENLNYDCSEIADDLVQAAGGKGEVLTIRSSEKFGQIEVTEYGSKVDFDYHTVYSDGKYIYDPRYSEVPIPKDAYLEKLKQSNGGNIEVATEKLE
ncbi:hypothetical protein MKN04_12090 [Paenibacillus polymyxa]|uniref:hypothetical protein n=1 Tax=Paenibacillus polymyxa TaxID=1406 RepID=UPI0004DA0F4D|nr:hypothetical protein [Paenibacillus polymyxa]KEO79784.1 hypothetical protein EL23_05525 [Paenibacillus polymyxa]MCH6188405.1 hypothetical protein [Paenibacillus polymyxa]WRL61295.1 hypothetical protein U3G77_24950 [Paenibacillus polymyxa]